MLLIYLAPTILESIDQYKFGIKPDLFPISLGTLVTWIIGYLHIKRNFLNTTIYYAFCIIFLGLLLSGFFSDTPLNDITRSIAFIIGIIASIGFGRFLFVNRHINKLYLFFLALNLYWVYYVFELFISGNISMEYHFNSYNQNVETINSHTVSTPISISIIYLFHHYLFKASFWKKLIAFLLLILSTIALLITQVRSNLVLTIIVVLIIIFIKFGIKLNINRLFLLLGILLLLIYYLPRITSSIGDSESSVTKRFDFSDSEYQSEITSSRTIVYLKFLERLKKDFFGTGIVRPKLYLGTENATNLLMHNQYATWAVAGGWISFIGSFILILSLFIYFKRFFKFYKFLSNEVISLNLSILIYFLTLFSLDQSSHFFFLFSGLLIYQQTFIFTKKS